MQLAQLSKNYQKGLGWNKADFMIIKLSFIFRNLYYRLTNQD